MNQTLTSVEGGRLEAEIRDGRVSIGDVLEEGTLRVKTDDTEALSERMPVAEVHISADGIEASIALTAPAVADVIDALEGAGR